MSAVLSVKPINSPSQPTVRLPMLQLVVWLPLLGVGMAAGVAIVAGLLAKVDWVSGATLAAAAVVGGTLAGLGIVRSSRPRPTFSAAMLVMAASMVRMGVSLGLAMVLFFSQRPEVAPFWAGFLGGSLVVLAAEVMLVRPTLLARPEQTESLSS